MHWMAEHITGFQTRFQSGTQWDLHISTLWLFNIAMENGPFVDGLPIKNGDFPWLCLITRGYIYYIDIFSYGFTTGHIAAKELGIAASTTAKESGALNASSKAKKVAQSRSQVPGSSDTVGNGQFTNKIGIYIIYYQYIIYILYYIYYTTYYIYILYYIYYIYIYIYIYIYYMVYIYIYYIYIYNI